jgi:hypothetical protein
LLRIIRHTFRIGGHSYLVSPLLLILGLPWRGTNRRMPKTIQSNQVFRSSPAYWAKDWSTVRVSSEFGISIRGTCHHLEYTRITNRAFECIIAKIADCIFHKLSEVMSSFCSIRQKHISIRHASQSCSCFSALCCLRVATTYFSFIWQPSSALNHAEEEMCGSRHLRCLPCAD